MNMVALDLQKTSEQMVDLLSPLMRGQYFRFNPPTQKEIGIDNPDKRGDMLIAVDEYFSHKHVGDRVEEAVRCFR